MRKSVFAIVAVFMLLATVIPMTNSPVDAAITTENANTGNPILSYSIAQIYAAEIDSTDAYESEVMISTNLVDGVYHVVVNKRPVGLADPTPLRFYCKTENIDEISGMTAVYNDVEGTTITFHIPGDFDGEAEITATSDNAIASSKLTSLVTTATNDDHTWLCTYCPPANFQLKTGSNFNSVLNSVSPSIDGDLVFTSKASCPSDATLVEDMELGTTPGEVLLYKKANSETGKTDYFIVMNSNSGTFVFQSDCKRMFQSLTKVGDITKTDDVDIDTSAMTDCMRMFAQCGQYNVRDRQEVISWLDTSHVTGMKEMFAFFGTDNLDLRSFDTSNVLNMSYCFQRIKATTINITGWDVSKVNNVQYMFDQTTPYPLQRIYVSADFCFGEVDARGVFNEDFNLAGSRGTKFCEDPEDVEHRNDNNSNIALAVADGVIIGYEIVDDEEVPIVQHGIMSVAYETTLDANGGAFSNGDITKVYCGDAITLSEVPVRAQYDFLGWNTSADGTGHHYDMDDKIILDADMTLYAEWRPISLIELRLYSNGGEFPDGREMESVLSDYDHFFDITEYNNENAPTKEDKYFVGWSTDSGATIPTYLQTDDMIPEDGSMTLYAVWSDAPYAFLISGPEVNAILSTNLTDWQKSEHLTFTYMTSQVRSLIDAGTLVYLGSIVERAPAGVDVAVYYNTVAKDFHVVSTYSGTTLVFNEDSSEMFMNANHLNAITMNDISINTTKVTSMSYMFSWLNNWGYLDPKSPGCDISNFLAMFDTSSLTDSSHMFERAQIVNLDVSNFNMAKVTNAEQMFVRMTVLETLDITGSGWAVSNITNGYQMFGICANLTTIWAETTFDISAHYNGNVFEGNYALVGGNNTHWELYKSSSSYAHVDVNGSPGYFTAKP